MGTGIRQLPRGFFERCIESGEVLTGPVSAASVAQIARPGHPDCERRVARLTSLARVRSCEVVSARSVVQKATLYHLEWEEMLTLLA